jgi:hypothetical protein
MGFSKAAVAASAALGRQRQKQQRQRSTVPSRPQTDVDDGGGGGATDDEHVHGDDNDNMDIIFDDGAVEMDWHARGRFRRVGTVHRIANPHPELRHSNARTFSEYDAHVRRYVIIMCALSTLAILLTVLMLQVQWTDFVRVTRCCYICVCVMCACCFVARAFVLLSLVFNACCFFFFVVNGEKR